MEIQLLPSDLVRLAELMRLSAQTAKLYSDTVSLDGKLSRITELSQQIETAADELAKIGKALQEA